MELKIDFIRDLPIPDYGEWTDKESEDWLHPCHGPLPHNLSLLRCLGGDFIVALWETPLSLQTFVDLRDEPAGEESEAYKIVGPIPRTYCWRPVEGAFHCGGYKFTPPGYGSTPDSWRRFVCRQIMMESVRMTIEQPLGVRSSWEELLRPASSFPTKRKSR